MASAAAMAAAHSVPPVYAIPLGPRIRPPRLLPGTKAANTDPQPEGGVPTTSDGGKKRHPVVWVQGKWRHPRSNAAKDQSRVRSRQVEKALAHETHGMNIYAYRHIRTNQVVYSLTRVMQNFKALKQLLFHGKQTVPSALRRDLWRPHFSVEFEKSPAGALVGLKAFRLLRELALRRQLSPLEGSLIATQEDVDNARNKYDPSNLAEMEDTDHPSLRDLPRLGKLLPPKYRAKKLMDQKVSSVADLALVLKVIMGAERTPADLKDQSDKRSVAAHLGRTKRNRQRINDIRRIEESKQEEIEDRQSLVQPRAGQLGINSYAAERLALEHGDAIIANSRIVGTQDLSDPNTEGEIDLAPSVFDSSAVRKAWKNKWKVEGKDEWEIKLSEDELEQAMQEAERIHNHEHSMMVHRALRENALKKLGPRPPSLDWATFENTFAQKWKEDHKGHAELPVVDTATIRNEYRSAKRAHDKEAGLHAYDSRRAEILKEYQRQRPAYDGTKVAAVSKKNGETINLHEFLRRFVKELKEAKREKYWQERRVKLLWSDIRDATYADSWPDDVEHERLDAKAVVNRQATTPREETSTNVDEVGAHNLVQASSSPHVIGRFEKYQTPATLEQQAAGLKGSNATMMQREKVVGYMLTLSSRMEETSEACAQLESDIMQLSSQQSGEDDGVLQAQIEKKKNLLKGMQAKRTTARDDYEGMRARYPIYAECMDELDQFSERTSQLSKLHREIRDLRSTSDRDFTTSREGMASIEQDKKRRIIEDEARSLESEIRDVYDPKFPGLSKLEKQRLDLQHELIDLRRRGADKDSSAMHDQALKEKRPLYEELCNRLDAEKLYFIIGNHERKLKELDDANFDTAADTSRNEAGRSTDIDSTTGRTIDQGALDAMGAEVDQSQLGRRGLWGRLKGVFGR